MNQEPLDRLQPRRRRRFTLVAIILGLVLAEAAALIGCVFLKGKGVFYVEPTIESYDTYLETRDPILGWTAANARPDEVDPTGSRIIPAFPDPGASCVSLYGDSFTWALGVRTDQAWGNLLSKRLGCRVANYGVPGFGSDQAFLRFRQNEDDKSDIVILGHLAENIIRNVTQDYGLAYPGGDHGLKPRFTVAENGRINLVPLPDFNREEFDAYSRDPQSMVEHEYFYPGGPSGIRRLTFPFSISLLRAFEHFRVRAELAGRPAHAEFYRNDHAAHGLEVTVEILSSFYERAAARGKVPLIVIIPTAQDLEMRGNGPWVYQNLVDRLEQRGVEVLDFGDQLSEHVPGAVGRCDEIYFDCTGHLTVVGNELLASFIYQEIARRAVPTRLSPGRGE